MNRDLLPVLIAPLAFSASLAAQTTVETYTGTGTYACPPPGMPMGPGLDFPGQRAVNTLSFTPGSVTFMGQPVDFSGTEAAFLATSYTGTASVPVNSGPATVDVPHGGTTSGATNNNWNGQFHGLQLGPGFNQNMLDIVPGSSFDSESTTSSWSSPAVPALNGVQVTKVETHTVTSVNPVTGVVNTTFTGQVDAVGPVPALPFLSLTLLVTGLVGAAWMMLRRRTAA